MTPQLTNLRILAGKDETNKGEYITMSDADFDVRIRNIEITPTIEADDENSKHATGDHGEDNSIMGAQSATIAFAIRAAWGGDATTEPNWLKFAKACGCKATQTDSTSGVKIEPVKEYDGESMSIQVMDIQRGADASAIAYRFAGCMGNMVLAADGVGKPWMATFTYTGKIDSVTDVAAADILAITGASTVVGEKLLNAPVTLGGTAGQQISSFALDIGNDEQPEIDQSDPTGYKQYNIVARRPRLSVNPLQQLTSAHDIYTQTKDATTGACSIATSSAAAPHFTITVPVGQSLAPALAAREGLLGWALNYKAMRNGTSDTSVSAECGWQLLQGAY